MAAAPCEEYLIDTHEGEVNAHLIGVDSQYRYFFQDTASARGHVWRHAHTEGPIDCDTNPHCLEVVLQEGIDCQSHAIVNLLHVLDRRGALPPSWLRDQLRASREDTLNLLIGRLFIDGTGDDDDELHANWRGRTRAFLRGTGVRLTKERSLDSLSAVDDLYNAVESGEAAFIVMSFQLGTYTVQDLDDPLGADALERRQGAFVRTPHKPHASHAVAAVGAFRSPRGQRYLVILNSNTATFSVWNVDKLANKMRRHPNKVGLYEYMLIQPR